MQTLRARLSYRKISLRPTGHKSVFRVQQVVFAI